jgi:hypothetical protein
MKLRLQQFCSLFGGMVLGRHPFLHLLFGEELV